MNVNDALRVVRRHTPIPSLVDEPTFSELGDAFAELIRSPSDASVPVILESVGEDSDNSVVVSAAHVLSEQPKPTVLRHLADLPNRKLPTRWVIEIYLAIPTSHAVEHLKVLLATEAKEELFDDLQSAIDELSGVDLEDQVDELFQKVMRERALPQVYARADDAFRKRAYGDVIRILTPYSDVLSSVYTKKLEIASRKAERGEA